METVAIRLLFGLQIHQDFIEDYPDLASGFENVFESLSVAERRELYEFLSEVVQGPRTPMELAELWMLRALN